jgi:hypothetical protein
MHRAGDFLVWVDVSVETAGMTYAEEVYELVLALLWAVDRFGPV